MRKRKKISLARRGVKLAVEVMAVLIPDMEVDSSNCCSFLFSFLMEEEKGYKKRHQSHHHHCLFSL